MPIHDWTRVDAGLFHNFHQAWIVGLSRTLNRNLPPGYYGLIDREISETESYTAKANRIVIRHPLGDVVAVIEIVSPGNKDTVRSLRKFVEKSVQFLQQGVHLLVIDLFPPSKRDPGGVHQAIWAELDDRQFEPPADKPLTLAAYSAGDVVTAYVEPVAVGDVLPAMPIFLTDLRHIPAPLAETYQDTWNDCPAPLREAVEGR